MALESHHYQFHGRGVVPLAQRPPFEAQPDGIHDGFQFRLEGLPNGGGRFLLELGIECNRGKRGLPGSAEAGQRGQRQAQKNAFHGMDLELPILLSARFRQRRPFHRQFRMFPDQGIRQMTCEADRQRQPPESLANDRLERRSTPGSRRSRPAARVCARPTATSSKGRPHQAQDLPWYQRVRMFRTRQSSGEA